jgi:hypothetical protein
MDFVKESDSAKTFQQSISLMRDLYAQKRFPLDQRLALAARFIKHHNDLPTVAAACSLMDHEAHLGLGLLGYRAYLDWYEKLLGPMSLFKVSGPLPPMKNASSSPPTNTASLQAH